MEHDGGGIVKLKLPHFNSKEYLKCWKVTVIVKIFGV